MLYTQNVAKSSSVWSFSLTKFSQILHSRPGAYLATKPGQEPSRLIVYNHMPYSFHVPLGKDWLWVSNRPMLAGTCPISDRLQMLARYLLISQTLEDTLFLIGQQSLIHLPCCSLICWSRQFTRLFIGQKRASPEPMLPLISPPPVLLFASGAYWSHTQ